MTPSSSAADSPWSLLRALPPVVVILLSSVATGLGGCATRPRMEVAQEFDREGEQRRLADPSSAEVDALWERAARAYRDAVEAQLEGTEPFDPAGLVSVAERLFAFGRHVNRIPENRSTFASWEPGPSPSIEHWTLAADIYEAALRENPDVDVSIRLGRTYGFLQRWIDAAGIYAKVFEQASIVTAKDKRKLDTAVVSTKPQLLLAYLEWGVAERMAFKMDGDKTRLLRCLNSIFPPLAYSWRLIESDPEIYWGARYHQVQALVGRGEINDATLAIMDIQRSVSPTFDDDVYGYATRFKQSLDELRPR